MQLLDNKSITIDGIDDFVWAPHDNFFTYTTLNKDTKIAKVGFIAVPTKKEMSLNAV